MYKKIACILLFFVLIFDNQRSVASDELIDFNNTNEIQEILIFNNNERDFASTYILLDILKFLPMINVSDNCYNDIKRLEEAIDMKKTWAIKGIDHLKVLIF